MPEKRSKSSLAFRLNITFFLRQFWVLLWLDVTICALFAAGLIYSTEVAAFALIGAYSAAAGAAGEGNPASDPAPEQAAPAAAQSEPESGSSANRAPIRAKAAVSAGESGAARHDAKAGAGASLSAGAGASLSAGAGASPNAGAGMILLREEGGRRLYWRETAPPAFYPDRRLVRSLPEPMDNLQAGRWIDWNSAFIAASSRAEAPIYRISLQSAGGWLVAETALGFPVSLFFYGMMAVLAVEILSLISSLRHNARNINKTLRPVQELMASTRALTAKSGRLSPEAVKRFTGALDSISGSQLDARLPLSGLSNELKPLASAINEMLARIDETYRSQIRFVSDASHELRTPIAVIRGYADLLSRWGADDPETMRESVAAIRQEAEGMKEMVEQLLFLARGESDFMRVEWKAVDVSALGEEVLREIGMIDESHLFSAEITPDVRVMGDDGMLKQLMRILIDNSAKYTPAGGVITLRVDRGPAAAMIIVQDEGNGISEEAIPHIFDRFYRADESRTRGTGGAGLGLPIAKWIAQRHKGSIEVTSRENIGTRMAVLLPLYDGRPLNESP